MAHITDFPLELIEHILYTLDPLDISRIAQSSRLFRELIYGTRSCQRFWRGLYLAQPLDDPRKTVTYLGYPRSRTETSSSTRITTTTPTIVTADCPADMSDVNLHSMVETSDIDWQGELQRIIRARTVVLNPRVCREGEWGEVLRTLLDVATTLPPVPFQESDCTSKNVVWILRLLRDGALFDIDEEVHGNDGQDGVEGRYGVERDTESHPRPRLTPEEVQLLARLHTWVGLTRRDVTHPQKRIASRAFVYDLRNYSPTNNFGPFMLDGSMRVNWRHMQALAHVYGMLWLELERDDIGEYDDFEVDRGAQQWGSTFTLSFCQSVIPPGMNLDRERDWAGVEGLWYFGYCFLDHRELLIYNYSSPPPLDTSIFEGDDVPETHCSVVVYFRVIDVEPDPTHPTRPKINFAGELDGNFSVIGSVQLTSDEQVRWYFKSGNDDQPVWSGEAISLGGVGSQAGILGVWSTVFHDIEDPVGPMWLRRQKFIVD